MSKALALTASLLALSAQQSYASTTYYFYQPGWTNGGVISGSFTGEDIHGNDQTPPYSINNSPDGYISSFEGEITNFSVSMTGSSNAIENTSWNQSNIWGIVFNVTADKFLGNDGGMEGFGMFAGVNNNNIHYFSGYGPNLMLGGNLYTGTFDYMDRSGLTSIDSTSLAIMIDTNPITLASYNSAAANLGLPTESIPEPSTYGLGLGAMVLAAVAFRRRTSKSNANNA